MEITQAHSIKHLFCYVYPSIRQTLCQAPESTNF
jgi:hypothetical protein